MRWRWSSSLTALVAIGVLTSMSGCGADRDAGAPEPGSPSNSEPAIGSGTASATSVTAATTGIAPPTPGPMDKSGTPVPVVRGDLSVRLNADHYPIGAVLHVTVANGLDHSIYTEDFKTACTIVILQRRDASAWTDIVGCALGRPTATVEIGAGLGRTADLDPTSFHLTNGASGPAFGAGSYRVKFTYRAEPAASAEDPLAAYSTEFPIR